MHKQFPGFCRFLNKRLFQSQLSVGIFLGFVLAYFLRTYNAIPPPPCRVTFPQLSLKLETIAKLKNELDPAPKNTSYLNKTLEGNGVISKVRGGIGNQLFHYACTYALSRDQKIPLFNFVPIASSLSPRGFFQHERHFVLDKFQIPLTNVINKWTSIDESTVTYVNDSQLLFRTYARNRNFLQLSSDSYCISYGFWAQYKNDILSMFQLKQEVVREFSSDVTNLAKDIENYEESVAVHVRRGDFMKHSVSVSISFQRDLIIKISNMLDQRRKTNGSLGPEPLRRPKFFIFSDDIAYCRRELNNLSNVYDLVFVYNSGTGNRTTSLEDLFLMMKCKHFIIPNSTFSWWAAYLGTHKGNGSSLNSDSIVIAAENKPGYWNKFKNPERFNFYRNVIHGFVLFPNEWIIYYPSD